VGRPFLALTPTEPILCPTLVGREAALEALERVADQARHLGQTALIAGEAGIGKSRLLSEIRLRAERSGFEIFQGSCFEPDASVPYAPVVDALRARFAVRSAGEVAAELGSLAADLSRIVPELIDLFPDLTPPVSLPPVEERQRLFHALTRMILGKLRTGPTLVIIEDLNWCDDGSLEWLLALARLALPGLFLALTYRTEEVSPGLHHFLAEADRRRLVTEVTLAPLSRPEVARMVEATLGLARPTPSAFVDAIDALADGNPFFIEEILKSLAAAGHLRDVARLGTELPENVRIPRSVEEAVLRRLAGASPDAQRVLTLAAVLGRRCDFPLLQELAGRDAAGLLRQVEELVRAQLLVEESADRFAFRHALTREAVYGRLLKRERQSLHRTVVRALERRRDPGPHLADLAYHAYHGAAWQEALVYANQMGAQALALHAPRSAVGHFSRALEAERRLGRPASRELLRARGAAFELDGDFEAADADLGLALDSARASADEAAVWEPLSDLGFLWLARDYEKAGDLMEQALELAERMDDPERHARSLNRVGNWHVNMERPEHGHDLHRKALGIFEGLHDLPGLAETQDLLGVSRLLLGDRIGAIAHFERAAALYRELDQRRGLASVLATLAHLRTPSLVYAVTGGARPSSERALGEAREGLAIARDIGWRSGEAYAAAQVGACLAAEGSHDAALEATRLGLSIADEIQHREWLCIAHSTMGIIHLDSLEAAAAVEHCGRALELAGSSGVRHLVVLCGALLAWAHLLAGDRRAAASTLAPFADSSGRQRTLAGATTLRALADVKLAMAEPAEALELADRLIEWAARFSGPAAVPGLWKLRGEALANLGRMPEAEVALSRARDAALVQSCPALVWRIDRVSAAVATRLGHRADARLIRAGSDEVVQRLAVAISDGNARDDFLRRALGTSLSASSARAAAKRAHGGLTAREREVAAMVGRGLSNREIAAALFVSERTVESHTSHIREKLGLTSRAQVAAWVVARGLLDPSA
jgi:DNA-binding NarL/FixJ family response regulator/tetratricopeptide (TPR) repeat protein